MEVGEVHYATSTGGVDIAWREYGRTDGPLLVLVPGFVSHLDMNWEFPPFATFCAGLGRVCRVLAFDKRGTGLSGRDLGLGSLAERADDIRAVMEAAGWDRAHLLGISEGGPLSILYAASHPERALSLTLYGTGPRFLGAPDFPQGPALDVERFLAGIEGLWGTGRAFAPFFAGADDARRPLIARFERNASTPRVAAEIMRRNLEIDVRDLLSSVAVPTLVVHATGDPIVPVAAGRYLAEHIPGARYVEVDAAMHASWDLAGWAPVLDAVSDFVAGSSAPVEPDRVLATVLFTDIVDSTRRAAEVGDRSWRTLLDLHDDQCARLVARHGGRVVKQTGDGVLATFDGPARAVRCAQGLRDALADAGLGIRAGLHTGEVERRGDDVGGIGVHVGARIAAIASSGEVLVSRTVRDLVVGSDLAFEDRGTHALKGVPEPWQLFAAVG